MRIALINENSQAAKNAVIYSALKKVADEKGFDVRNYGMYSPDDSAQLTYVQNGILAAVLLNSGAADFVVTGCGTGEGAMLALNSFPGVICGHIETPLDAYTFAQINAGNAVSIPYALGFGWGGDLNLQYIFEKLWSEPFGSGYPKERAEKQENSGRRKRGGIPSAPGYPYGPCKKGSGIGEGSLRGSTFRRIFRRGLPETGISRSCEETALTDRAAFSRENPAAGRSRRFRCHREAVCAGPAALV